MPDTFSTYQSHSHHNQSSTAPDERHLTVWSLGMSLGVFFSLTFTLCVLFDLWLPQFAMNPAWVALLPGFVWISWSSFALGLVETFAYGWYVALIFVPLYHFFSSRGPSREK